MGPHVVRDSTAWGVAGTGQARRMAPAFRVFRVLRPVRIHRAAIRHLDADRPLHQHGSARHDPHCSSLGAARRLSARITTICSSRQPRRNRPVRSNHCVRAESAGPNGIHCRATTSASRLADRNDARDCSTPDNSDWTTNMVPPSTAAPTPSRTADPEPDARHRRRWPGGGRNRLNTGVPAHRHIGRIADNDVKRPGGQRVG